ncbi:MAG: peptidase domain-containing ABC transporter [Flavobacteriaceae bacterium]
MKIDTKAVWDRFFGLIKLEKRDVYQVFYYAIFAGAVSLSLPLGIQAIINLIQGAQISNSWVILVVLVTLGVMFTGALQIMQLRIIETLQQRIFTRSSFELSYRFPKIRMSQLRNYYPPELANRFFDTLTLQKGLSKILIDVPTALIQIIFALVLLSFYHPFFIFFGLSLMVLMYFVFRYTVKKGVETSLVESKNKYRVAHWIQEVARSIVSFKLSGNTQLALNKNDALVCDYLKAREDHFKVIKFQYIKMIAFKVTVTAGLLVIGGALVLNQQMNIGQFVAAEIVILLVITSVEKLIVSLETLYDMLTAIEKLGQVVDFKLESQEGKTPEFSTPFRLELDDVWYSVEGREEPVLSNISFCVEPKEVVLLRGVSGSGKSSLMRVLAGVNTPTSGSVFIDNTNLKAIQLNHFRTHLGLSLSDEVPFEGTLRENLTFGNTDVDEQYLEELLSVIGLKEFVRSLPFGLDTLISPEGRHISYTVTKKIILIRALLKQPKMLLLEDPLDQFRPEETSKIIDYLCDKKHNWSIVVISNNSYWNTKCTKSLELNEGQITNLKS